MHTFTAENENTHEMVPSNAEKCQRFLWSVTQN